MCFDGRGNGGSSRPSDPSAYSDQEFTSDAVAVMDATGIENAVLISLSRGALWALRLCAEHPDRVLGAVVISPALPLAPPLAERRVQRFDEILDEPVDWEKYNAHYWKTNYPDFVDFFVRRLFTEPHSTKQIEDAMGWALETDGETLTATQRAEAAIDAATIERLATEAACPVLVIHGTRDAVRSYGAGEALAQVTGGQLATLNGAGHCPHARDPVRVNLLIKQFADGVAR
jgi:pimeloyl-ACP methyl ester carboxylesterase